VDLFKTPHIVIQLVWTVKSNAKPQSVVIVTIICDDAISEYHFAVGMVLKHFLLIKISHLDLRATPAAILVALIAMKEVALPFQESSRALIAFNILWKGQALHFGHEMAIKAGYVLLFWQEFFKLQVPLHGVRDSADVVSQVLGQHATVLAFVIAAIVGDEIKIWDYTTFAIEF
jgi:hypothetical protein